jgi:hypothetical protein
MRSLGFITRIISGQRRKKTFLGNTATPEEVRVDSGEAEQAPGWVLSSGEPQKEQKTFPPIDKDPHSQWDFRIGKNGVIEHFRTEDGRVAVRETGVKIEILDQDHDRKWRLPWSGLLSASAVISISMETSLELEPWLILWSRRPHQFSN